MYVSEMTWSRGLEDTGTELDGLRVVFDQKVALFTATLHKKPVSKNRAMAKSVGARSWSRGR